MAEGSPRSLAEITRRLQAKVDEKRTTELKAEVERSGSIGDYFQAIEEVLQGNPDVKALQHWIDSSAAVLGRNLSRESLGSEHGKNVAEGIAEITEIEDEIAENHKALRNLAAAAGVDMEMLLADGHDEDIQAIVALREEKTARIAELRTALRAYALDLIRTLQENNRRKLGMHKDELRAWQEKFAALESLPQDYRSFAARMEQDFVAAKRRPAESLRLDKGLEQLKERSIAVSEKVWGDYAHHVAAVLDQELPGDANEEKRRHLLAGLLRDGDDSLLSVYQYHGGSAIIIKDEIKETLPQEVMINLAKRHATALTISQLKLHDPMMGGGGRDASNRLAYEQCIQLITALDEPGSWSRSSTGGTYINGDRVLRDYQGGDLAVKKEELFRETGGREIDLANQVDATIRFLFGGLDMSQQRQATDGHGDYQTISPVWKLTQNYPRRFSPSISAPVTPDGVFYSRMDEPAEQRVAMREAKEKADAFMQGLSSTLNRDRLQHERKAVTPADVESKNNARILAAEQQALSTQAEAEAGRKAIEELKRKEEVEQQLRKELASVRSELESAEDAQVAQEKRFSEQRREQLELTRRIAQFREEKELLQEQIVEERKETKRAKAELSAVVGKLREALEKPGWMSGTLKDVVRAIIDRPASVAKAAKKGESEE